MPETPPHREPVAWLCRLRRDGSPHQTPIWFVFHGATLWIRSAEKNRKVRGSAAFRAPARCPSQPMVAMSAGVLPCRIQCIFRGGPRWSFRRFSHSRTGRLRVVIGKAQEPHFQSPLARGSGGLECGPFAFRLPSWAEFRAASSTPSAAAGEGPGTSASPFPASRRSASVTTASSGVALGSLALSSGASPSGCAAPHEGWAGTAARSSASRNWRRRRA
ncbi:pyridoxamine 5'-phosphate oxidase family protein [Actinoplanes missouriensis]|uniref:pyridoxamine 5'-phosphate oxidase family protein n=1 Tax=Actinoplanes missouriensis TaxID=1866 RepID=UPI00367BCECC